MSSALSLEYYIRSQGQFDSLTIDESSEGTGDAIVWTVTYRLSGEAIGTGSAGQKWLAKDLAAKNSLRNLGWGPAA